MTSKEKKTTSNSQKEANDIRIGMNTRVSNVVRYCNGILKEKTYKTLKFSAVGGAIGKLVSAVEIVKIVNSGLYQSNKLATVSYKPADDLEEEEDSVVDLEVEEEVSEVGEEDLEEEEEDLEEIIEEEEEI